MGNYFPEDYWSEVLFFDPTEISEVDLQYIDDEIWLSLLGFCPSLPRLISLTHTEAVQHLAFPTQYYCLDVGADDKNSVDGDDHGRCWVDKEELNAILDEKDDIYFVSDEKYSDFFGPIWKPTLGKYKKTFSPGLLKRNGYFTSRPDRVPEELRRSILEDTYFDEYPRSSGFAYLEWGYPQTCVRLKRMADAIICYMYKYGLNEDKTNITPKFLAWKDDLDWLKENYYDNTFENIFVWPSWNIFSNLKD